MHIRKRMKFMNTYIDNMTMEESVGYIDHLIKSRKCAYVVTPNTDHIIRLETDTVLQEAYRDAELILTDGKPLIWISKFYKKPIIEKVSGSDLFPAVCKLADEKNYSMFLLGAAEGVGEVAANNLMYKYKNLSIVGLYSPPFGFENDKNEIRIIEEKVKQSRPDILIVGLGCPKQEKYMHKHYLDLEVPVLLGLGASIDFEAGKIKRAPSWMSNLGLEWFYRLVKEPKRMYKRYLVDDMKIFKLAIKYWR